MCLCGSFHFELSHKRCLIISYLFQQFNCKKNHTQDEHKKANAIDPMHIPDKLGLRLVRLAQVEVLGYLMPEAHGAKIGF